MSRRAVAVVSAIVGLVGLLGLVVLASLPTPPVPRVPAALAPPLDPLPLAPPPLGRPPLMRLPPGPAGPRPSVPAQFVQGAADSPGRRTTATTITFSSAVAAGDLLVGWFGQYEAPGSVQVSDEVNGAWTRSRVEHFVTGAGDVALYYVQNTKAAPQGLTATVAAGAATYLPSAAAEFSGVATAAALDQTALGEGVGTTADTALTPAVPAGELVVALLITGQEPWTVDPGQSQGVPFTLEIRDDSASADVLAIAGGNAGPQHAPLIWARPMDWYEAVATFRPAR